MLPQPPLVRVFQMAAGAAEFLALWWVQSTLVIAAGLTVAYILRRRGPALQSAIYRTTLVAALVCPVAGALLSAAGIGIPNVVLPHIHAVAIDDVVVAIPQTRPATPPPAPVTPPREKAPPIAQSPLPSSSEDRLPSDFADDPRLNPRMLHGRALAQPATAGLPPVQKSAVPPQAPKPAAPPPVVSPLPPLPPLLVHRSVWAVHWLPATAVAGVLAIWLLGTLILSTRLAISLVHLLHLYRSASPVAEDRRQLCRELSHQLGVRPPRLLQSPFVTGPCLAGFFRATILLPEESFDLPLAAVLVHELAHSRRGDCRWNLVRQASLAVLFWQPLVWRLSQRMETVAEEVCDDHVVHWGSDPTVYASGLVRLAEQNTLPISTVVPLVTFRSLLGQRVQRILDSSRRLSLRTGVKAVCAIAVAGLAITLLVGAFGSDRPNAAASKSTGAKTINAAASLTKTAGSREPAAPDTQFTGTVVLPDGKPAVGAQIFVVGLRQTGRTLDFNNAKWIVIRASRCDASGHFVIPAPDLFSIGRLLDANLLARSAGGAIAWQAIDSDEFGAQRPIKLRAAVPLRGRLVTADGRPAAGIRLKLRGMQTAHVADRGRNDAASIGAAKLSPDFWPSDITTDAGGWYSVPGIAADVSAALQVNQKPYAPQWVELDSTMPEAKRTTVLAPAQIVKGVVVAGDTGKPLAGALVKVCQGSDLYLRAVANEGKTDAQGRFRISPLAAKSYTVAAFGPGGSPYLAAETHFDWNGAEREHEVRIVLPRGVLVSGTITDDAAHAPVAGATVTYTARESNPLAAKIPLSGTYPPSEPSDEHGRFSFAVPAGAGHLTVRASDDYVVKPFDPTPLIGDKSNGELLPVNADAPLDLAADARESVVNFTLHRGMTVAGQIVRTDGSRPMRVLMQHRGTEWLERDFRGGLTVTLTGGGFEIRGLPPEVETPVYLLDPDAKEGTIFVAGAAEAGKPQTVRLKKCGSLAMRYLDPTGKPIADFLPDLYMAFVPGNGEVSDVGNFDHVNCFWLATDDTGRVTFPTLIPGASYGLLEVDNKDRDFAFSSMRRIVAKPGERIELPEVTIGNPRVLSITKTNRNRLQLHYQTPTERAARADVAANSESSLRIRGTVVDASGNPVAGAKLFAVNGNSVQPPQGQNESPATTDGDGRFDFVAVSAAGRINDLIAAADGFELARVNAHDFDSPAAVLRLVPDTVPLTGRLVSIEGQPVVGAQVAVCRLWPGWGQNLNAWEKVATGQRSWFGQFIGITGPRLEGTQLALAIPPTTTDAEGRFTVRGIGRERIVELLVSGRGIESKKILARTRNGKKIVLDQRFARDFDPEGSGVLANGFTDVVGPSNAIVGRVTDLATGEPLAGITVLSQSLHGKRGTGAEQDYIRTRTDADGRYRLEGMPLSSHEQDRGRGDENKIGAYTLAEPYLPISRRVRVDLGPKPVTLNFQLPRGVWVEGRVSEATGRPLVASVEYGAFWSNPLDKKLGDFRDVDLRDFRRTDSDGRFRVAAMPGRGMVAVAVRRGDDVPHPVIGAEKIREVRRIDEMLRFQADTGGFTRDYEYSAVAEINPAENAGVVTVDFKLPCETVTGRLVNADGKPDNDAIVYEAQYAYPKWYRTTADSFEVDDYDPAKPRRLVFYDVKLNQAAICVLSSLAPKSLIVRLQPAGSVRGRLVDQDGTPLGKVQLLRGHRSPDETRALSLADMPLPIPQDWKNRGVIGPSTDDQGRFEIHGLIPGREYYVDLMQPGDRGVQSQFPKTFSVRAGETKDLGDIVPLRTPGLNAAREAAMRIEAETTVAGGDRLQATGYRQSGITLPAKSAAATPGAVTSMRPASNAIGKLDIRGTAVDPSGKPVARAKLFVTSRHGSGPALEMLPVGASRADGNFEFTITPSDLESERNLWIYSRIYATADGYGIALGDLLDFDVAGVAKKLQASGVGFRPSDKEFLADHATAKPRVLHLVSDESPLIGRIVSLEGRPIAAARAALYEIQTGQGGNLDAWQREADKPKPEPRALYAALDLVERSPQFTKIIAPATTDRDGRFTMRGIGRDRVVSLIVSGPGIESRVIWARTRAGKSFTVSGSFSRAAEVYYPNGFTHAAGPSNPIVGRVTDQATGKPLAGVTVLCQKLSGNPLYSAGEDYIRTVTDADGRYRLEGMPIGDGEIGAYILDKPYVATAKPVRINIAAKPTTLDIPLPHGIWAEGRATDKSTGLPLAGHVKYYVFLTNPILRKIGPLRDVDVYGEYVHHTDADGRYRIAVLPGPGIIGFSADDSTTYGIRGAGGDKIPGGRTDSGALSFRTEPYFCSVQDFNALTEINPPENAGGIHFDFALETGRKVAGRLVDARGKPVVGAMYYGSDTDPAYGICQPMSEDSFQVNSYDPSKPRRLVFYEPSHNLAAIYILKGEPPDPFVVRLDPAGSVRGRLVNEHGTPLRGLEIEAQQPSYRKLTTLPVGKLPLPVPPKQPNYDFETTDDAGNFVIHGLIPGRSYNVWISDRKQNSLEGKFSHRFSAQAGELKNLGDVTLNPSISDDVDPSPAAGANSMPKPTAAKAEPKATQNKPVAKPKPAATAAKPSNDSVLQIRGKVIDPQGKPVAGAKLFTVRWTNGPPTDREMKPWAVTGANGRFEFQLAHELKDSQLVAAADGFGLAFGDVRDFDGSNVVSTIAAAFAGGGSPALHLVPDDKPLTGRIISIDGRPIAGARIELLEVWFNDRTNLDAWEKAAKDPKSDYHSIIRTVQRREQGGQLSQAVPAATTSADGRFAMRGIGRERIVRLLISGPGIESKRIWARTRNGEKIVVPILRDRNEGEDYEFYGNGFTLVAGPSNAIVGRVTDRATGKPLARVTVLSQKLHGNPISGWGQDYIRTVTDADGRYRIDGMPLGNENTLGAFILDEPYLPTSKDVRVNIGPNPITLDFRMPRGVWIEGRVTDRSTGKPVQGMIQYFAFGSNPFLKKIGRLGDVDLRSYQRAGADGRFRIAALPGRGIVGIMADDFQTYSGRGAGAEKIAGGDRRFGALTFRTEPYYCAAGNFTALAEVNPSEGTERVNLDFQLDSGTKVIGKLVDADGKSLFGATYCGDEPTFERWSFTAKDSFTVNSYDPGKPRWMIFSDTKRNLAAVYMLSGQPPKPLVVRLQPAGTIRGRVVDSHGRPMARVQLLCTARPKQEANGLSANSIPLPLLESEMERGYSGPATDDNGRFEVHGLVPGHNYRVAIYEPAKNRLVVEFPKAFSLRAGEAKDLGDVRVVDESENGVAVNNESPASSKQPAAKGNKPTASNDRATDRVTVRGRVVDPSGKPVAGAVVCGMLHVHQARGGGWHHAQPPMETKSDSAGRFTLECLKSELVPDASNLPISIVVGASMPDNRFGPEWTDYDPRKPHDLTLQLVPDEPIEGHIIDLEGKPVAGADVSAWISKNSENDLSKWLAALKLGMPLRESEAAGSPEDRYITADGFETKTDSAGRFKLAGIGRERLVRISVSARGFVTGGFSVVTRPMDRIKADEFGHISIGPLANRTEFIYGSHFTAVLDPEQTIEGYVRDAISGKPIAGANLAGFGKSDYMVGPDNHDTSDSKGHYRIHALHAGDEYELTAETPRQPYLRERVDVPKAHGLGTIKFDLALHRGVLIHGRITDKQTGQPVQDAEVRYLPSRKNPHFVELRKEGVVFRERSQAITDDDGRFMLIGIPGRGLIEVIEFNEQFSQIRNRRRSRRGLPEAESAERSFPLGQGFSEIADLSDFAPRPQSDALALKEIRIGENEAEAKCEIQLEPSKPLELKLVDPQGHPLDGVEICGATESPRFRNVQGSAGATTKVLGLGADEQRTVVFRQPERKLGRVVIVSWKKFGAGPATITLEPCATIKLRLVDAAHQPQRGSRVDFIPTSDFETRDTEFFQTAPTDADGRLVYSTLAPGETYTVASQQDGIFGDNLLIDKLAFEPGKTIDLGELNVSNAKRRSMRQMKTAAKTADIVNKPTTATPAAKPMNSVAAAVANEKLAAAVVPLKPDDNVPTYGIPSARVTQQGRSIQPIEGRIVDLQGQPVAGVEIQITNVMKNDSGDLTKWLKEIKGGLPVSGSGQYGNPTIQCWSEYGSGATVKTNADGRFRINAIGHDHVAYLNIFGAGIVPAYITVVARPMAPIKVPTWPGQRLETYYGAKFQFVAEPSQPVEGIVRDAKTGKPVAGVRVDVLQLAGNRGVGYYYTKKVYAWTDARGHYRLDGLPQGTGNRIKLVPPQDSRYFARELDVPTAPGFQPVQFNIDLHVAVLIRGKLTNKVTGEPIGGAHVYYAPSPGNPNVAGLPEFKRLFLRDPNLQGTAYNDGQFTLHGLPGPGIIIAEPALGESPTDRPTVLAAFPPGQGDFRKLSSERRPGPFDPTIVKKFQIPDGVPEIQAKIEVDPGHSLKLNFVGSNGKPLEGVSMSGYFPYDWPTDLDDGGTDGTVLGLSEEENRVVLLQQSERKLGKAILINWKKDGPGPITVKLESNATVKARLVDDRGQPLRGITTLVESKQGDNHQRLDQVRTDRDGRFVYDEFVPGTTYRVTDFQRPLIDDISVSPGATIDFGDVDVTVQKPAAMPKPATQAKPAAAVKAAAKPK